MNVKIENRLEMLHANEWIWMAVNVNMFSIIYIQFTHLNNKSFHWILKHLKIPWAERNDYYCVEFINFPFVFHLPFFTYYIYPASYERAVNFISAACFVNSTMKSSFQLYSSFSFFLSFFLGEWRELLCAVPRVLVIFHLILFRVYILAPFYCASKNPKIKWKRVEKWEFIAVQWILVWHQCLCADKVVPYLPSIV